MAVKYVPVQRICRMGSVRSGIEVAKPEDRKGDTMGFRFRRSIKLFPGIRVNLSKSGVSTSIGTRGATVNIRGDRVRETVGIPGTGVSYSEQQRLERGGGSRALVWIVIAALIVIA